MINPFPTMFLAVLAHAFLRVVLGLTLVVLGYKHLTHARSELTHAITSFIPRLSGAASLFALYIALAELILGLMFIAGFYTQIAALAGIAYALKMLVFRKHFQYPLFPSPIFYVLMIGVALSLFITGAGAFAIDMPI